MGHEAICFRIGVNILTINVLDTFSVFFFAVLVIIDVSLHLFSMTVVSAGIGSKSLNLRKKGKAMTYFLKLDDLKETFATFL